MYSTVRNDGSVTDDPQEIVQLQADYFGKLYTENESVKFNLKNETNCKLNTEQKAEMDKELSIDEIYDAMMTLKRNKMPGCDGLPIEFYHTFWKTLSKPLFRSYQYSIKCGKLNMSSRRAVINLIPKKCDSLLLIKSWHPISLLNYEYKILAKAIAN